MAELVRTPINFPSQSIAEKLLKISSSKMLLEESNIFIYVQATGQRW